MTTKTFSLEEVATALECSPRWLAEQVRCGRFPARKIARQWRFTETDVVVIFEVCANSFEPPVVKSQSVPAVGVPIGSGLTARSRKRLAEP